MQISSAALDTALAGDSVTWAKTHVFADWDANNSITSVPCTDYGATIPITGYGSLDAIDDLSDQVGNGPLVVKQSMDDGWPSEVTISQNTGVAELDASMAWGTETSPTSSHLMASQYFSIDRADSEICGNLS